LLICVFLLNFAFSGLQSNFSLFTLTRFQLTPGGNAALFAYLGLLAAFFQGFLIRRLMPKFGEKRLARIGLALMAAGFAVFAGSTAVWMLYVGMTITAAGNSLVNPSITGLVSKQVSGREQGQILGVTASVGALTRVIGPVYAGFAFDAWGPAAPYWTGVIWILAGLAVFLTWRDAREEAQSAAA
jgi:MFS family permease